MLPVNVSLGSHLLLQPENVCSLRGHSLSGHLPYTAKLLLSCPINQSTLFTIAWGDNFPFTTKFLRKKNWYMCLVKKGSTLWEEEDVKIII